MGVSNPKIKMKAVIEDESPPAPTREVMVIIPEGLRTSAVVLADLPYPIAASMESAIGKYRVLGAVHGVEDLQGDVWTVEIHPDRVVLTA